MLAFDNCLMGQPSRQDMPLFVYGLARLGSLGHLVSARRTFQTEIFVLLYAAWIPCLGAREEAETSRQAGGTW